MTTTVKQISFKQVIAQFKNYVANTDERPALQYLHYDGENFVATNGHVLLKVNADYVSDIPEEVLAGTLFDPNNMCIPDETGGYPDIYRLIPDDCNLSIRINNTLDEIQSHVKAGNKTLKGSWESKNYLFACQDDFLKVEAVQTDEFNLNKWTYEGILKHNKVLRSNGKEIIFKVRSNYITNALATVKKLSKLSNKDIQFNIISGVRPIIFKQDNVFEILVLPLKIY